MGRPQIETREVVGKLFGMVAWQQIALGFILARLAKLEDLKNPGHLGELMAELQRHQEICTPMFAGFCEKYGLPGLQKALSSPAVAGGEFEAWFRRQFPKDEGDQHREP
jgi:hypothetical protein